MSGTPTLPAPSALEACDAVCERMIDHHGTTAYGVDWSALRKSIRAALASGATQPSEPMRSDLQAVLLELDVPVVAYLGGHSGKLVKDQNKLDAFETEVPLVMQRDHRAACQKIAALATPPTGEPLTAPSDKCSGCNGNGMVGGLRSDGYHSDECPFCKGSGIEALAATAAQGPAK